MPIKLKNLFFSYGDRPVYRNFSLDIADGNKIWLSAESGFGKTTLLRLISGLEKPADGSIEGLKGKKISAVFQEDRLLPWLTVQQNITAVLNCLPKAERLERTRKYLQAVGLAEEADTMPSELSGGMARRAAIARALAADYDILLLDEPFTGIDPEKRESIAQVICRECADKTLIAVTHDPEEARLLCLRKISLAEM